jgi:hypothetical protein
VAQDPDRHPNAPRRAALGLAFAGVVFAGLLGGTIGWGVVDTSCSEVPTVQQQLLESVPGYEAHVPSCDLRALAGALGGAVFAAVGVGIVAALMLRAQSEWRTHLPAAAPPSRRTSGGGSPPRT